MGLQLRGGFEAFLAHFWKEILFKEMSLVIKRRCYEERKGNGIKSLTGRKQI